jgi:hypothetical protein
MQCSPAALLACLDPPLLPLLYAIVLSDVLLHGSSVLSLQRQQRHATCLDAAALQAGLACTAMSVQVHASDGDVENIDARMGLLLQNLVCQD